MFLQNAWYVAAWETEIGDTPFARTILNEPVVLYRSAGGIIALEDRCCHRALPLSMGKVVDNHLQCGYHGLEFDGYRRLRQSTGPVENPAWRTGPFLSRHPALGLGLDMAGRSRQGR